MSGQCLSASGAGRALTPARHLRLGGPLPHQLANTTWAPPGTPELWSCDIIGNYPVSLQAMPDPRVDTHALLPLTLLPIAGYAQLACLIQAANVRSEPGSNPSKVYCAPAEAGVNFEFDSLFGVYSKNFPDPPLHDLAVASKLAGTRVSIHLTAMTHSRSGSYAAHLSKTESVVGVRLATTFPHFSSQPFPVGDRGNDSRQRGSVNRAGGFFWEAVARCPREVGLAR